MSHLTNLKEKTFDSCINGLRYLGEILEERLDFSRLSGIKKYPYIALNNVITAPAYIGTLFPKFASTPPIAGPRVVPTPTTA